MRLELTRIWYGAEDGDDDKEEQLINKVIHRARYSFLLHHLDEIEEYTFDHPFLKKNEICEITVMGRTILVEITYNDLIEIWDAYLVKNKVIDNKAKFN